MAENDGNHQPVGPAAADDWGDATDASTPVVKSAGPVFEQDVWIYRIIVIVLSAAVLICVIGGIYLAICGKTLPDSVVAIGSAAVGAIAGLLAPTRRS